MQDRKKLHPGNYYMRMMIGRNGALASQTGRLESELRKLSYSFYARHKLTADACRRKFGIIFLHMQKMGGRGHYFYHQASNTDIR